MGWGAGVIVPSSSFCFFGEADTMPAWPPASSRQSGTNTSPDSVKAKSELITEVFNFLAALLRDQLLLLIGVSVAIGQLGGACALLQVDV